MKVQAYNDLGRSRTFEVGVGDKVVVDCLNGVYVVTDESQDIKNGEPGFSLRSTGRKGLVPMYHWCYATQIERKV